MAPFFVTMYGFPFYGQFLISGIWFANVLTCSRLKNKDCFTLDLILNTFLINYHIFVPEKTNVAADATN